MRRCGWVPVVITNGVQLVTWWLTVGRFQPDLLAAFQLQWPHQDMLNQLTVQCASRSYLYSCARQWSRDFLLAFVVDFCANSGTSWFVTLPMTHNNTLRHICVILTHIFMQSFPCVNLCLRFIFIVHLVAQIPKIRVFSRVFAWFRVFSRDYAWFRVISRVFACFRVISRDFACFRVISRVFAVIVICHYCYYADLSSCGCFSVNRFAHASTCPS